MLTCITHLHPLYNRMERTLPWWNCLGKMDWIIDSWRVCEPHHTYLSSQFDSSLSNNLCLRIPHMSDYDKYFKSPGCKNFRSSSWLCVVYLDHSQVGFLKFQASIRKWHKTASSSLAQLKFFYSKSKKIKLLGLFYVNTCVWQLMISTLRLYLNKIVNQAKFYTLDPQSRLTFCFSNSCSDHMRAAEICGCHHS